MKKTTHLIVAGGLSLACSAFFAISAHGQTSAHWVGSGGNYHTGSNWNTSSVPTADGTATFDGNAAASSYTIGWGGVDSTVGNARFLSSGGTITLNIGNGIGWTVADTLQVGNGAGANPTVLLNTGTLTTGTLNVHSGATFSMNLAGTGGTTATLNTLDGSNIATSRLDIAGFERGFTWNILGGSNTGSTQVRVAASTGSNATVNVDGASTTWNTGSGQFDLGFNGKGTLNIAGGAVVDSTSAHLSVSGTGSGASSASIADPGSEWNLTGTLRVGQVMGQNSLSISNGGHVSAADARLGEGVNSANNSVTVTGVDSAWALSGGLVVGGGAGGNQVTLFDGGSLITGSAVGSIGRDAASGYNSVVVSGGSWQMNGEVAVGNRGSNNSLTVTNGGGVASASTVVIGSWEGSNNNQATVSGVGSAWAVGGTLTVGREGSSNSLLIEEGGLLTAGNLMLSGTAFAATNHAEVSHNGQLNVIGNLTVGGAGSAAFTLASGGQVNAGNLQVVGAGNSFAFAGGTLATQGATISNGQAFVVGDGTQSATWRLGGDHTLDDGLLISENAALRGNGTIAGNVAVSGMLSPGNSIGALSIGGDLTLGSGSITFMELTSPGEFDEIHVSGNLIFGGELTVSLLGGYTPVLGDTFRLFEAGSSTGSFGAYNLPALANGLSWNTDDLYSIGDLTVIPEPQTTALLFGMAVVAFLGVKRRRAGK